jgi:hypothetical protein
MRFALAFGLFGILMSALAVGQVRQATGVWWILVALEVYLAVCFFTLAAAYGLCESGLGVEDLLLRPVCSTVIRLAVMPYLIVGAIILYLARWIDREGLLNAVVPGIYLGRLPFPSEHGQIRRAGIQAVLNLCWEFPRLSGVDQIPGVEVAHLPILDGVPPTPRQFDEAIRRIMRWRTEGRRVLVHCAQGHGRSSTILAASLVRIGLASDVRQALALISKARPSAKPSREQYAALNHYIFG